MNTCISLFEPTDSKQQYERFIELARSDYDGLKTQIQNHFTLGMENDLRDYKINILSESAYSEVDNNIVTNVLMGSFLPPLLTFFTIVIIGESANSF